MRVSQAGIDLIRNHEQCRLKAYKDPAGVWTIGWGSTFPEVSDGQAITQAEADARLSTDLLKFDTAVSETCPNSSQLQHDACVSLAFNIGAGAFAKSSVARLHNAGRYSEACQAFSLWNKAGGKVLIELVHRRADEAALYASGTTIPDAVKVDVPVSADGEKSLITSRTLISTATAGLGTAASVAAQVSQQAQIVRDTADGVESTVDTGFHLWQMFGHHAGYIAVALIVLGLAGIVWAKLSERQTGRT